MKELMLGNKAVARGLYEAGCRFISSYPGTPSTEITEEAAKYQEIYAEWAPNEKVAFESALGASIGGARSFAAMKHVGLNVAADPLFTSSYTGVNGGLIIGVADDPGMHSSQNEQDSRHYAIAAKVPMVLPSDSAECIDYIKEAYEISEKFDTPVLFATCTRIAHSQSIVETSARTEVDIKDYVKDPKKYVMTPGNAIPRHVVVEERMNRLAEYAETTVLNRIEKGNNIGVITSGTCYQYVKEIMPEVSVLKLGLLNPLPSELIKKFAASVEKLYIVEELDPIIETFVKTLGVKIDGGKEMFGVLGELSQNKIALAFGKKHFCNDSFGEAIPVRPPVMCPGCPHRGLFYTLSKLKLTVMGDIGCYTLGSMAPLFAMDATICMGASISSVHGFNVARGKESAKNTVAVIGDSTFMHSGMTGLVNIVYNKGISTVLVLDNSITGMTGHQQNPTTGLTLKNEPTKVIKIEDFCKAIGVESVRIVDPQDLKLLEAVIKEETAKSEPSVIVVRRPCALLKSVKTKPAFSIDPSKCVGCKMCMKIGCPAVVFENGKAHIDETLCVGCGLCEQMCKVGAICGGGDK